MHSALQTAPAELLAHYGYLAVFVGCLLEGETILILAGFAAHQGYLSLPWVLGLAVVGGTLGDQIFFFLGRRYGSALIGRFPRWTPRVRRIEALLRRYHAGVIVAVRFLYGLRVVGPIAIGASDVPPPRFILFNAIGALLWAALVGGIGYLFGEALQWMVADLKRYEKAAFLTIAGVSAGLALLRLWRRRRRDGASG